MHPLTPRRYGAVNLRGCWTLYRRGMARFWRFSWHSLGGPLISSAMFLAIFALAAPQAGPSVDGDAVGGHAVGGLPVMLFLAPGVVVFSLAISAFKGTAVPVLDDKLQGTVGDFLMAPLSPGELLLGYVLPAVSQAVISAVLVAVMTLAFVDYAPVNLALAGGLALCIAFFFALLGALVGLWADKWEHYGAAETFLLMPLSFLSGSFFSVTNLSAGWRDLMAFNPVFLAVNGFRFSLTGYAEAAVWPAPLVLSVLFLALGGLLWRLLARGYKLRP